MLRLIYILTLLAALPLFGNNEEPGNESRVNTFRNENEQTLFNRYRDRGSQFRKTRRKLYLISQREKKKQAQLKLIADKKAALAKLGNNPNQSSQQEGNQNPWYQQDSNQPQQPYQDIQTTNSQQEAKPQEHEVHVPEIQNMDGRAHNPVHPHHHVPEVEEHFPEKEKPLQNSQENKDENLNNF